jgi:pimeloyl-ACP methyl ester carboxylesterase
VKYFLLPLLALAISGSGNESIAVAGPKIPKESPYTACYKTLLFLLDKREKNREILNRTPRIESDYEFLQESKHQQVLGLYRDKYDPKFKTRFYYTATARPDSTGDVPMHDPQAKGLVVYLHGSGTARASGANFSYKANRLANMGYSVLSFDLPFHGDGPRDPIYAKTAGFMKWLSEIIIAHKTSGQPVTVIGHSAGANFVGELARRHPETMDTGVMLSPAGFTNELKRWYRDKTLKMIEKMDVEPNEYGSRWAAVVNRGMKWSTEPKNVSRVEDPTVSHPGLKIRVVTGEHEEFVPGPLDAEGQPTKEPRTYDFCGAVKKFFMFADCHVEKGAAHLLTAFKDADGNDLVIREVMNSFGDSPLNENSMKQAWKGRKLSPTETLGQRKSNDPLFSAWLKGKSTPEEIAAIFKNSDETKAKSLVSEYDKMIAERKKSILLNIAATQDWAPQFYNDNRTDIENIGKKGNNPDRLNTKYFDLLESLSPEVRARHATWDPPAVNAENQSAHSTQ